MERFLQMVGILAALYIAYALSLGKWNYETAAQKAQRKETLKQAGLSSRFYFMNVGTLLLLTLASAGTFTFYWLYKQWQQIRKGFKRAEHRALKGNAFWRAVAGFWSFFALGNLINRTCEYTRRPTSWPACLWGTLWLGGLVLVFSPVEQGWKILGYLLFCAVPAVFQRRINTLTHEYLPLFPRAVEIIATLAGAGLVLGLGMLWRLLGNR